MNYRSRDYIFRNRVPALAAALLLAGCAGLPPKQEAPQLAAPQAADFAKVDVAAKWPAADWWARYNDPQLNQLISATLADSPSVAVAQARVRQAKAFSGEVAASSGANLGLNANVSRQLYTQNFIYPPPLAGSYDTSGDIELDFSYDFDFWGRNRSALQATLGQRAAAEAEAAGTAASLSAAVAKSYYQWQTLNARIALIQQVETARRDLVKLEGQRVHAGVAAGDNLHPLVADAAAPRQTLVQMQTQRDQVLYQLKALVGSKLDLQTLKAVELPKAEGGIPDSASVDLLARRPDVAAARDRVQASLSDIEVARAEFYPDFSISAFLGLNSLQMGKLLRASSRDAGVTPALHLPIFDAGRLKANLEGSRADLSLAVAQYDQTVRDAVADVNDAAVRLNGLQAERASLETQQHARQRDLDSAKRRIKAGLADRRESLRDELGILVLNDLELLRQSQALQAQIDLIKALGGGYGAPQQQANQ